MARGLTFRILEEEGLYCLCSGNKGADQLHGYHAAVFVFTYAKIRFSHDVAQIIVQCCLCTSLHYRSCALMSIVNYNGVVYHYNYCQDSVSHVDGKGRDWKTWRQFLMNEKY